MMRRDERPWWLLKQIAVLHRTHQKNPRTGEPTGITLVHPSARLLQQIDEALERRPEQESEG